MFAVMFAMPIPSYATACRLRQYSVVIILLSCLSWAGTAAASGSAAANKAADEDQQTSDLSYESYVLSDKRFKCLYGYAAEKTGDHEAAMAIFNDCIKRWNDVYSMIWLAQMYEAGVSVPQDLQRSTELMKRGAMVDEPDSYATLARFHYGVALFEGRGVAVNEAEARHWLQRAADEGLEDAREYLASHPM
ncbi:tetratricopeptide repeat protein [Oceanobacter mangrovi]|uniref:tetratricopeptide repeat protein n=1 Tax=Oceanobacter mangrovi TaxID=2862510 RepID=UPI001C8ED049|nr:hypothetical protein [Oceanobacter mangrovi]